MDPLMKVAFSPCPNDTVLFHAFIKKLVPHNFDEIDVNLADIQILNKQVLDTIPDLSKISFFVLSKVLSKYCLLPVGSALGYGNGPKIVSTSPKTLKDLPNGTLAIPGQDTTAYLLYRLLTPHAKIERFCRYDEVPKNLRNGAEFGLIIHETRFNLEKLGLHEVCDLGKLWEKETKLPLPLGGLVSKRSLGKETIQGLSTALIASYDYAKENPEASRDYILENSIEKDPEIIQSHIDLYVNEETRTLSKKGMLAIKTLLEEGAKEKLLPEANAPIFFED